MHNAWLHDLCCWGCTVSRGISQVQELGKLREGDRFERVGEMIILKWMLKLSGLGWDGVCLVRG